MRHWCKDWWRKPTLSKHNHTTPHSPSRGFEILIQQTIVLALARLPLGWLIKTRSQCVQRADPIPMIRVSRVVVPMIGTRMQETRPIQPIRMAVKGQVQRRAIRTRPSHRSFLLHPIIQVSPWSFLHTRIIHQWNLIARRGFIDCAWPVMALEVLSNN